MQAPFRHRCFVSDTRNMTPTVSTPPGAGPLDASLLLRQARGLLVLHELSEAAPLRQVIALLETLAGDRSEEAVAAYAALFRALAECAVSAGERWPATGSQALATAL